MKSTLIGMAMMLLSGLAAPALAADAPTLQIETKYGTVTIQTRPDVAPNTVARIVELARAGFYNGLSFHRVVSGFVVQGGDPEGTGRGGSGVKLKAEFSNLKHEAGTVAMARTQDPNSADSQFYISLGRHPHLDGQYTIFGRVTQGLDVVEKIKQGDTMTRVTVVGPRP